MPHHLLAPTDFSKPSELAIGYAADMARCLGARLTLVHIHESPVLGFPEMHVLLGQGEDTVFAFARTEMTKQLERLKPFGIETDSIIHRGDPCPDLLVVAKNIGADLIVIGTNGRRGVERALLGSVTERLVRTSAIPVLVIPPPSPSFSGP